MGFWDNDSVSVVSRRSHDGRTKYGVERTRKSKSRSHSREDEGERERERGSSSFFGGGGGSRKRSSSRASFFSMPGGSRSSFFGLGKPSSSYYKRSPRKNFISRALKKLRQLLRTLSRHAKRNPLKVLMLVVVPLITCGALTALLARFGLKLPAGVEKLIATAGKFGGGGDSAGLVGEAMKMAGGLAGSLTGGAGSSGGGSSSSSSSGVGRGSDGEMWWERKKDGGFFGF